VIIRSRKTKKDRQYNDLKKKDQQLATKKPHRKLKHQYNPEMNSDAPAGLAVAAPVVTPSKLNRLIKFVFNLPLNHPECSDTS
jgi:hypothetical protein